MTGVAGLRSVPRRRLPPDRRGASVLQPLARLLVVLAVVAGLSGSASFVPGTSAGVRSAVVTSAPAAVVSPAGTRSSLAAAARGGLVRAASAARAAALPAAESVAAAGDGPGLAVLAALPWVGVALLLVLRPRPPTIAAPFGLRRAPTGRAPPAAAAP